MGLVRMAEPSYQESRRAKAPAGTADKGGREEARSCTRGGSMCQN
jgi:hypothetical protein